MQIYSLFSPKIPILIPNQQTPVYFKAQSTEDVFENSKKELKTKEEIIKYLIEQREEKLPKDEKTYLAFMKLSYCKENKYIRTRLVNGYKMEDYNFKFMNNIFKNKALGTNFTVYRGCSLADFGYEHTNVNSIKDFYEKGKVVTIPTYISTSLDEDIAKTFPWHRKDKQKLLFKINLNPQTRGVYLDNMLSYREKKELFYDFDDEEEVFIDRNLKVKMIDKYNTTDGYTVIEFDALGHAPY